MNENLELVKNIETGVKNLTDEQVKQQFRPFVESVARRQLRGGTPTPMEELLTRGEAGLMEAWHLYNPVSGYKFIPYAVWFIRQAELPSRTPKEIDSSFSPTISQLLHRPLRRMPSNNGVLCSSLSKSEYLGFSLSHTFLSLYVRTIITHIFVS